MPTTLIIVSSFLGVFIPALGVFVAGLARIAASRQDLRPGLTGLAK
jgi:hypothetical protein